MGSLIGDRYEVLEVLWTGGSTSVARGIDRRHDRAVCLKITGLDAAEDPQPLLDEGKLLLGLPPHPAMPIVRDDLLLDDRYVLVIDWVEGDSAAYLVREQGNPGLPVSTVLGWLPAVASALDHLHAQRPSVVHGDVRLGNIIVNDNGQAALVFGAAALRNAAATSVGDDVRMLANTVIALLTGTEPEPGEPISWDGVAPELAKSLDRVLRRALAPGVVRRPGAASELVEQLQSARETALPTGVVTFVLTDIQGSTPLWEEHPTAMAGVIARHHELAAEIAEAHRGRMPRSQGEGDSTLSAFGRATDAAAAAIAFQRALADEPWPEGIRLSVRAGLHTGEAQLEQGDYLGAAVSRAARIRGLAHGGQVLVSHTTAELIADQLPPGVTLHDFGRFALAGLSREEEVSELRADDLDVTPPPTTEEAEDEPEDEIERSPVAFPALLGTDAPFLGREAELAALRSWWTRSVGSDHRRVVFLGGEAGMGKTRLTIELARVLHDQGATVLAGRCYEENVVPYQPFVEAIGWYLRTAPAAEARAEIVRTGSLLTRLVPDVAADFADLPDPVHAEPDTQRYLMFEAVNDLLVTLASSAPVLLVLEDLHWADRPTLALLTHLARNHDPARLTILGTYRADEMLIGDNPLRATIAELRRDQAFDELALAGLDEDDVGTLVAVACPFEPDSDFVQSMRRETEGNPFFVREICSHVTESGTASGHGGFTLGTLGVPDGVKQVIGRRVEHLPEAAGRALTAAAVIGREFDLDVLVEISGDSEDDLLDALDEASAARVVEETGLPGRYSFLHALTREALYDSLSATRRSRLHLRVAHAIETLRAARIEDQLGVLAYQYAAAGSDPDKALEYAERAGQEALRRLAHEEAAGHFERGLALDAATGVMRCELLFGLAEARRRAGDVTGARDAFIEAGAVARALGDAERLARAAIANYRGHVFASPGWHEPAIDLLEEALTVLPDTDDPLRARVLAALGLEVYFTADQDRADAVSAAGVDMARRLGDDEALAFCLACRHTAIFDPDHLHDRLDVAAELIEVGARIANPELALTGRVHRACDLLELARIDEARAEAATCATLVEELGQPALRYFLLWLQSTLALIEGHFDDAEKLAQESFDLGVAAKHPDAAVVFGTQMVILAWQRGDTTALVEPTLDILSRVPDLPAWHSALALVLALGGRVDEARTELQWVLRGFDDLAFSSTWTPALIGFSEVARLLDEPSVASRLYDGLSAYADRISVISLSLSEMGPISRALGVLAGLMGDFDAAVAHLLDALATTERIGAAPHATRTRVNLARVLLDRRTDGDVDRARELLDVALPEARELGMARVLLEALELRSRLD